MILNECLIWALGDEGVCGINVYCVPESKETVEHKTLLYLNEEWEAAMDSCEEEYGDCVEKDNDSDIIAGVVEKDYGTRILLEPQYLLIFPGLRLTTAAVQRSLTALQSI